jgi:hypothetical protein
VMSCAGDGSVDARAFTSGLSAAGQSIKTREFERTGNGC